MRAALLATGLDLDADEKAAVAALEAAEREAAEKSAAWSLTVLVSQSIQFTLSAPDFATTASTQKCSRGVILRKWLRLARRRWSWT